MIPGVYHDIAQRCIHIIGSLGVSNEMPFLGNLIGSTAIGMSAALQIYFGTYLWGLSSTQLAILILDSLVEATLSLFLAPYLSRKLGALPYIPRLMGLFFENGDPLLVPAIFLLASLYTMGGASSAMLTHALVGDVVEESQLSTGRRSQGLFHAANTFMQKSTSGLGVFTAGLLVAFVGLASGIDPRSIDPAIPLQLALVYVPLLLGLYIGGAMLLFFYRIDRTKHEANLEQLRIRSGESEYSAEISAKTQI